MRPFSPAELAAIREAIQIKYKAVANSAQGKFKYPIGEQGALALGYDPTIIAAAPARMIKSFCGLGNPFALGEIRTGDCLLDIGCGAGTDMFVASRLTGATGKVCGIDLTAEMVALARDNLTGVCPCPVEVQQVAGEEIPYADASFDVVISNGVINLSPHKQKLFLEIFRVLKPGGALRFADAVLEEELPSSLVGSVEAWSQ